MKHFKMNLLDWSVLALVIVGAVNWGLIGVAHFVSASANWNLVNILLGSFPAIEALVYLLVGLAGIYGIYFASRVAGVEMPDPDIKMGERGTPK